MSMLVVQKNKALDPLLKSLKLYDRVKLPMKQWGANLLSPNLLSWSQKYAIG